jgi:transcription termination/antitermination protein NusG
MNKKFEFSIGERVRIKVGPFQSFPARIVAIDTQKGILQVKVDIFGRTQPVELAFLDVEKSIETKTPPPPPSPN